jgi:hypothetical protein
MALSMLVAGCSDQLYTTMPQNQSVSAPVVPVPDLPRGIEDEFLRIEAAVPGYAGFFHDERGDIVVAVTNLDHSAAALAATAGVLDRAEHLQWRSAGQRADLRVRQVHYSFSQLLTWKNRLRDNASLIGVVELDADESHNRVRLALRDAGYADHIRATATRLGIPDAALRIEIMSAQPRLDPHRVIDTRRPTIGGIQIQRHSDGGLCSIGYHVRTASNQVYALTASHCTGNFTGGAIGQRWNQATTDAWGQVAVNPAWSTTGCAPDAIRCVDADAAAISYYAGVSGVTRVAETSTVGEFTAGNLTIGAQRDVAFPAQVVVGDTTFSLGYSPQLG